MWLPPQFDPSLTDASGTALAGLFAEIIENHPKIKIAHRIKDTSGNASLINMLTVAASAAEGDNRGVFMTVEADGIVRQTFTPQ